MKRLGKDWANTRIGRAVRGELYWIAGAAKIERIETHSFPGVPVIFLVLFMSKERTRYVYRPHEDSKWREEAQTILDLLHAAGGQNIADKISWEKDR